MYDLVLARIGLTQKRLQIGRLQSTYTHKTQGRPQIAAQLIRQAGEQATASRGRQHVKCETLCCRCRVWLEASPDCNLSRLLHTTDRPPDHQIIHHSNSTTRCHGVSESATATAVCCASRLQTRNIRHLLSPATSVVVSPAALVARHMTGLPSPDSSNFSGSLTSPIYLEQPRTFADCCQASACNLRPCPNTSEPRCA